MERARRTPIPTVATRRSGLPAAWRRGGLLVLLCLLSLAPVTAQEPVAPVTHWLATVDEPSQQIVLSWHPSADTAAMGYHICSGNPCLDYDTVFGRLDTSYRCLDHSPLSPHTYRIHVFDSAYNVSSLTPSFGNMVLSADVPPCSTRVTVSWTPYEGMPGGVASYRLLALRQPFDTAYALLFSTSADGPRTYAFDMDEGTTRLSLKLQALSPSAPGEEPLVSQSNVVDVERRTVDTARFLSIASLRYDSNLTRNLLSFHVDTSFHQAPYVLWRRVDDARWDSIASFDFSLQPLTFADEAVNPYDSLYCYRLTVRDACGLNPRQSEERCVAVPDPPPARWAIPNVLRVGDPDNGAFLPRLQGLKGDLYELHIYNRAGLLVFSSTNPAEPWTPSTSTAQGVYTYALRCRFNDNRIRNYIGTVLVLK